MQVLAGKVAFVTGASTGIGRATSVALARAGAKVVAVARREAELARTIEAVEAAGVVGLTKAAAVEYASKGVRINAVAPAVIPTPLTERAFFHSAELTARLTALHPMKRFGTVEEVANAVVWLLSPASSFTTGHVLAVDGGFLVP